jgi:hypothetical protein
VDNVVDKPLTPPRKPRIDGVFNKMPFPKAKINSNKINSLPLAAFRRSARYAANSYKILQQGISQQESRKPQAFMQDESL